MNIIYIGAFVENNQQSYFERNKTKITLSTTTFQRALLSGFMKRKDTNINIINAPDIGSFPFRSKCLFVRNSKFTINGIDGYNCGFINLTYFKKYSIYLSLYRKLNKVLKQIENESVTIVVYSLIYPYIKAAVDIKAKYSNVKVIPIVLDLPEYFGDSKSKFSSILPDDVANTKKLYSRFDGAIVLTKQMIEKIESKYKPNLLMEGIYDVNNSQEYSINKQAKTILYTGKLDSRFGIDILLDAFTKIKDPKFELWIYGDGSSKNLVKEYAELDKRIKYYGVRPQSEVFIAQRNAALLVNPRQNIEEYTKYSFPSKTMEYLASGTPTVMYKLDGIPEEYDEYLIYPNNNNIEELSHILEIWGSKPIEELNAFGEKGRNFILNNKTAQIQAQRLFEFLKNNYE